MVINDSSKLILFASFGSISTIERCAMFALKAVNAATLAKLIPASISKVSYDDILKTMYQTGIDMNKKYKETSLGGLAEIIK